MSDVSNIKRSAVSKIAWATGIACVACCTLPLVGVALGSAAIAGLAVYSEKAAIIVAAVGIGVLIYKRFARRAAPSCDLDCAAGPRANDSTARSSNKI